jgi:hypothetical protein
LVLLRRRAKAVEVVQPKVFYVVEVAHVIRNIYPLYSRTAFVFPLWID